MDYLPFSITMQNGWGGNDNSREECCILLNNFRRFCTSQQGLWWWWRRVEWFIPQQRGCWEKGMFALGWLLSFIPLILSGPSAHRMVPHTFRAGLFSSVMFSWKGLHRCTQRVSFSNLLSDPEPRKTDKEDEPSHRTVFLMNSPFIIEILSLA